MSELRSSAVQALILKYVTNMYQLFNKHGKDNITNYTSIKLARVIS